MRLGFSVGIVGVLAAVAAAGLVSPGAARAGTVVGRLELPPAPERGPVLARGFVDRVENPLADIKKPSLAPYLVVVLESEQKSDAAPAQVNYDLVGESFVRPVVAVPVGAEVVIKNQTKVARTIAAAEDPKLITGPLNPTGTKSFRATQPAVYTLGDKDAPHLRGKIVVVASTHVASLDDAGRFEMTDVPDGSYKLRVFYYDPAGEARGKRSDWLAFTADVTVAPRGRTNRTEVNAKLPAAELSPRAASGKK
ncbi:MAG TPA: hypothetical protein VK601_00075 [Kofleriaceae bacterium]|nr:hypothetical protein [Kofleriaceae bacterium]